MEKSKNKKKPTKNTASKTSQSSGYSLEENFSAEELQQITLIANAIVKAEEIRKQKEEKDRKVYVDEWYNLAGYKKYKSGIRQTVNLLKTYIHMLFMPERSIDAIKGDIVTIAVLKYLIAGFFRLVSYFLLTVAVILFIGLVFYQNSIQKNVILIWFLVLAFVFSRILRIVSIEVYNINDRNYIISLFASITTVISIVVAIMLS